MDIFYKIIHALLGTKPVCKSANAGPNTLAELLQQFDAPQKQKTSADAIRDFQMKEAMAHLELSYLQGDPTIAYQGNHRWFDAEGNKYFDFVPCMIRPEVLYCNYSRS